MIQVGEQLRVLSSAESGNVFKGAGPIIHVLENYCGFAADMLYERKVKLHALVIRATPISKIFLRSTGCQICEEMYST
jgi:hypothetical protein